MRKSTIIVATAASLAMVAASAGTSFASHSAGSNTGHAIAAKPLHYTPAKQTPLSKRFKAYSQPVAKYTGNTCDIDLSAIADFTDLTTLKGCKTTITFGAAFDKRSVPNSWSTWGAPPDTETDTPNIMYSNGATTATVDFGKKTTVGGFEVEPDQFQVETITVDFYAGPNGTGKLVGSITRDDVDGTNGAKLFAGKSKRAFQSAVITDTAGDDFAIAQIRLK